MSAEAVAPRLEPASISELPSLRLPLAMAWLMMLVTFRGQSGPGAAGGLDPIGLGKLGVRGLALGLLGLALLGLWSHPRRAAVVRAFLPLAMFVLWAFVSTLWSPLKSVSFGQAGSLAVLLLLATVLALRCPGPRATSSVLLALCGGLLGVSTFLGVAWIVSPEAGSLDRFHPGFAHPTMAAATSGLGILLLVLARLLWAWPWTRMLWLPGTLIHAALLFLAANRLATGLTLALVCMGFLLLGRRPLVWSCVVAGCVLATIYLALDPELAVAEGSLGAIADFARRGQTAQQMAAVSGRAEMWAVMWDSFLESPWLGHGYFVTSQTGELRVWYVWANWTAHNFVLQLLATTGIVGASLFLWGLIRPARLVIQSRRWQPADGRLKVLLVLVGIWYLGWGQLNSSIMGPVQPESIVFYSLLGLAVGTALASLESRLHEALQDLP